MAILLAAAAVLTCLTPRADAQQAPVITVLIMEASNGPGGVDPAIKHIQQRMGKTLGFNTWRLISRVRNTVPLGSSKVVLAPGNRQVVLQPTAITNNQLQVTVEIRQRKGRPMRVSGRLKRGGTFIVGGYAYGPGRLVFAITADF